MSVFASSIKELHTKYIGTVSKLTNTCATVHEIKITSHGTYHWAFNITRTDGGKGFTELIMVQNNIKPISIFKCAFWQEETIDIYLDTKTKLVAIGLHPAAVFNHNAATLQMHKLRNITDIKTCTLRITTTNSYINKMNTRKTSLCLDKIYKDINEWKKGYLFALNISPHVEELNNKYLECLLCLKQHEKAYQHAIEFKKGAASVCRLILDYYYTYRDKKRAHKLLQQLTDSQLRKYDLYFEMARCSETFGDQKIALKYYQLFLNQQNNATNKNALRCISNMALIYYGCHQLNHALQCYMKLGPTKIDKNNWNFNVGFCYWKTGFWTTADFYFKRSIEREDDNKWFSQLLRLFIEAQILNHKLEYVASSNKCLTLLKHGRFNEFGEKYIHYSIIELMINNFANMAAVEGVKKMTKLLKNNKTCMNCNATTWNQKMERKETTKLRKCKGCSIVFLCSRRCQKYHWKLFHRSNCVSNYYYV